MERESTCITFNIFLHLSQSTLETERPLRQGKAWFLIAANAIMKMKKKVKKKKKKKTAVDYASGNETSQALSPQYSTVSH